MAKKYFWIKLKMDFFKSPAVKLLRRIAGGDTYCLIYLEMILLSLDTDGFIYFTGIAKDMSEEIALNLDEKTEDVQVVLSFLKAKGLIQYSDADCFSFTDDVTSELIGSESDSAKRVRAYRERQKLLSVSQKSLQCNADVTDGNTEKRREELETDKEKELDQVQEHRKEVRQIQKPKSDSSSSLQDNFNKLWSLYPTGRKQGRKKAFAAYQRAIKNGTTNKEIQDGIVNYKKEIEIQKTPINYIKQGSTWFFNECWSDEYNFTPPVQKRNGREVVQKEALPDWANDQVEQEEQTAEQKQKKAELNKEIQRRLAEIKES